MINKKVWKITAVALLATLCMQSYAQEKKETLVMSLEQCLDYAKEHSITLKRAQLQVENYSIDESTAKGVFLPSVSASIGQNLNNTPFTTIDGATINSYSGSYGIDLSMPLYTGGENRLNVKQSKISTEIATLGVSELVNTLESSVTQIFVEILYVMEQIKVVESSLELSQTNIERGKKLLEVGSINETDYAQLETAEATEQYNLVVAQTTLNNKYLILKQLLEISEDVTLEANASGIAQGELVALIPSIKEVYADALEIRPEIKASQLSIESAELDERIAKSGYLPTVSLTAGIGVGHYSSSDYTFTEQLKNNYNNSIGVNVSIPIFSKWQTRNSVAKSRNAVQSATLDMTESSKDLYQTIESLHNNAVSAYAIYLVSESKLKALEKSLELVTQQYELGMKDIIELLTEQDNYRQSSQEYLESKYTLILNKALLEYYQTGVIKI